ncbi:hypothetical protein RDABS01_034659 [Bienertia sinuspersici]
MKGSSKVIMGATMAIVVILAIVLGLVLVLLAELYCSLLLRRRKLNAGKPEPLPEDPISQPQQPQQQLVPSPLSSFYAQGVLDAPRSFLFPKLPSKREQNNDIEKPKHGKLHQFLSVQSPQQIGLGSFSSPSLSVMPAIKSLQQPTLNPEIKFEVEESKPEECVDEACCSGKSENFMYISNPIYDNEVARPSHGATPFETPDSSPSHLDRSGSSSGGESEKANEKPEKSSPSSLPLSPMTELPAKATSVALRDARSLETSGSESNTQIGRSSSSSDTPHTSPSW